LLTLNRGGELAAPATDPSTPNKSPQAVGSWMGSPYNASSATARRAQIMQMQTIASDSDPDSDSDGSCSEPILSLEEIRAAVRLAATDREQQ